MRENTRKRLINWVWVLIRSDSVRADQENLILEVKVSGKVFVFQDGAILAPDRFCTWFMREFGLRIDIWMWEWAELMDHWFEMSEDAVLAPPKPVIPVPIPEGVWNRISMGDYCTFYKVCCSIVEVIGDLDCWLALKPIPDSAYGRNDEHRRWHSGQGEQTESTGHRSVVQ